MKTADIDDLELELWLRQRERGEILWKTKNGDVVPINRMTDAHLENAIKCIADRNERMELYELEPDLENAGDRV